MKRAIIVAISLLLTGAVNATEAEYQCNDGSRFSATFSEPGPNGSVLLKFAGQAKTLALPQAPSADGGRYTGGGIQLWIKGKTGQLTRAGSTIECLSP